MKNSKILLGLLPLFLFILFWNLGSWGVLETSEARYAEISREMLLSGNWLMPKLLGIYHFDKPLMTYWITAMGMKIFGINPFGARFFLSIAYLIQIFLVYKITLELFDNKRIAVFAAVFYAGTPLVLFSTLNLTTDAFLNTFELLAVFLLIPYYRSRKPAWLYLYFFVLGLALFTKGPVGVLLPVLMIYPVRKILHVKEKKNGWHVGFGIILMLMIGGTWFVYLMLKSPRFCHFFVGEQLYDRMFKASVLKRSKPFWYYLVLFPVTLLPPFSLIPAAVVQTVKKKEKALKLILIFGLLIPLFFFSLSSSKLILYVLPLAPYAVLTEAWYLEKGSWASIKKYYYFYGGFYVLLVLGVGSILMGYIPGFTAAFHLINWIFWVAGAGILIFFLIKKTKTHFAWMALLLPMCIVPIAKNIMKQNEIQVNSTAPIANFIKQNDMSNRKVIVWDALLPSLSFELNEDIYNVYYQSFYLRRNTGFQENTNWKKWLINVHKPLEKGYLEHLIASPSVFIVKRGRLPQQDQILVKAYNHEKSFGRWEVYY